MEKGQDWHFTQWKPRQKRKEEQQKGGCNIKEMQNASILAPLRWNPFSINISPRLVERGSDSIGELRWK
jgi:hypothetical protein